MSQCKVEEDTMVKSEFSNELFGKHQVSDSMIIENSNDQLPLLHSELQVYGTENKSRGLEAKLKANLQQQYNNVSVHKSETVASFTNSHTAVRISSNVPANNKFKSKKNFNQLMGSRFHDDFKPSHQLGPDHVVPADNYWAVQPDDSVKLRVGFVGISGLKPRSLVTMFQERVQKSGNNPAMSVKRDGIWQHWTYNQYWEDISIAAKGFLKLGLKRYHSVAMLGFNAPEWFISLMATICAGGIATGIYTTNSPEACHYILDHSRANIVVVENAEQLQKILTIRDRLPHLKAIVQYLGTPEHEDVFSWDDVMQLGHSVDNESLHIRIKSLAINQVASIVYTSGTTGNPKASMLSHDNFIACVEFLVEYARFTEERIVSYLPLNHIAAQVIDIFLPTRVGGRVYFAKPDALKGTLLETIVEVRPTLFFAVPRIYEKIKERLEDAFTNMRPLKKALLNLAMNKSYQYSDSIIKGDAVKSCGYLMVEPLINKMKTALGLNKVRNFFSGGAPFAMDTLTFFMKLNIIICETYGMTEVGSNIFNILEHIKLGSVGKKLVQNELKLINMTANGGEICFRGRNVFMGYMFEENKTKEALDDDDWFRSGDLGKMDNDGFLYITGRVKEIVITSGGENIAPIIIEENVKAELPLISQAIVIGDRRKFLTTLLTIKTEMDLNKNLPTDKLTPVTIRWCNSVGSKVEYIQDILQDNRILKAIQEGINRANSKAISHACHIQKWHILPRDFTQQSDEIGPTMKIKRSIIVEHYKDIIDAFYA